MSSTPLVRGKITILDFDAEYVIKKTSRTKSLALKIKHDRIIEIAVPKFVSFPEAIKFMQSKIRWLEKKADLLRPQAKKFFLNGKEIQIVHEKKENIRKISWERTTDGFLFMSPTESEISTEQIYEYILLKMGKYFLPYRCYQIAEQFNFKPKTVKVRRQKSRWGSCSTKGSISLNSRLMILPAELRDYIIIHELCHLRQPNHSSAFWCEVEKILPNYKELDKKVNTFSRY